VSTSVQTIPTPKAGLDRARFDAMHEKAAQNPDHFWLEQAQRLTWATPPTKASETTFSPHPSVKWFTDGTLNASANCIDRHLPTRAHQTALIWQGEDPTHTLRLTYQDLHDQTCLLANVLRNHGIERGDRVAIHLPAVAEGVIAMLACARIGATHIVLFGGLSADAISDRLQDSATKLVITADQGRRGAKTIPLKTTMDTALARNTTVETVLVTTVTGADVPMQPGRDHRLTPLMNAASPTCEPAIMNATDHLFLLYTSGSTGKPKGIIHSTGGYLLWAAYTHALAFDHQENDIFWCTADIGWITGHSYVTYGPLANGGTILMFEGMPSHPIPGRWWEVIAQHKVTTFYTSPTAIRAVAREGTDVPKQHDLSSLRILGSVGEPISAEAWTWFYENIGQSRCAVVDTWWQTETGGIMIAPLPGAVPMKPGAAMQPLPGIQPILLGPDGTPVEGPGEGHLCIKTSWPGQTLGILGAQDLFETTYFTPHPGTYYTGDGARRDADGDYWITGRVDDVINVSGHRIGSAELEDALATTNLFADAAAIGIPHDLKGQAIVIYAVPKDPIHPDLAAHATKAIAARIGRYAVPEQVHIVPDLPKTRSGKIVRRLLRKIATHDTETLGDLSTLANPEIVETLIATVKNPA